MARSNTSLSMMPSGAVATARIIKGTQEFKDLEQNRESIIYFDQITRQTIRDIILMTQIIEQVLWTVDGFFR